MIFMKNYPTYHQSTITICFLQSPSFPHFVQLVCNSLGRWPLWVFNHFIHSFILSIYSFIHLFINEAPVFRCNKPFSPVNLSFTCFPFPIVTRTCSSLCELCGFYFLPNTQSLSPLTSVLGL